MLDKKILTKLLQEKLDGKLETVPQLAAILHDSELVGPFGLAFSQVDEVLEFLKEITRCNIIPEAKIIAEKYDLTLRY